MRSTCIFMGWVSATVHLFWVGFCKLGARQDNSKVPREGRLPLPSQRGGTRPRARAGTRGDLPRRPASDPALVTTAVKGD